MAARGKLDVPVESVLWFWFQNCLIVFHFKVNLKRGVITRENIHSCVAKNVFFVFYTLEVVEWVLWY